MTWALMLGGAVAMIAGALALLVGSERRNEIATDAGCVIAIVGMVAFAAALAILVAGK